MRGIVMASPLVETKLYTPRLRRGLVARPRLSGRLSRAAASRLTLISAPAGFGKTTLLAEWAANRTERSVACLSLEESDSQPTSYWTYLITALQAPAPGVGTSALLLLQLAAIATAPIFLWELSLGVWLVVKGFKPSPIITGVTA
jgi:LuxR family maltose regulon positive regulatory protein